MRTESFIRENAKSWTSSSVIVAYALSLFDATLKATTVPADKADGKTVTKVCEETFSKAYKERLSRFAQVRPFSVVELLKVQMTKIPFLKEAIIEDLAERTESGNVPTLIGFYRVFLLRTEVTLITMPIVHGYFEDFNPEDKEFLKNIARNEKEDCNRMLARMQLDIMKAGLGNWL